MRSIALKRIYKKLSVLPISKKISPIAHKTWQESVRYFSGSHLRQFGLAASFPIFGMLTAYAVNTQTKEDLKPIAVNTVHERLAAPTVEQVDGGTHYWREEFVQKGDSLGALLNRLGVNTQEAQAFIYSNPISKDLLKLRVGQPISVLINDSGDLAALQFLNDDENGEKILVAISKKNGKWEANADELDTQNIPTVRAVTVSSSARGALAQALVPADIRTALNEIFVDSFSLDDLTQGDQIRLVYETFHFRGQAVTTGNILAAEVVKGGKNYNAYYLDHQDNTGAFYDANGKAINKGFEVSPLGKSRVTSPYGVRVHPISRTLKLHTGIDYAAPEGTPILAPADGVVVTKEFQNGYGNVVVLRHRSGIQTVYAHMSRFQSDIGVNNSVPAGKIIGYVGTTGRSTGPHLHYEVRVNGQAVDPNTNALPARVLSKTEVANFKNTFNQLNTQLAVIRNLPVMVSQKD